ncbi:MAG: carbohydrate-binding domain-containing protein [Ruminococcus sp.]|nr:carbohydrate-binding domain-containing protein [Ruminococcus sp.]
MSTNKKIILATVIAIAVIVATMTAFFVFQKSNGSTSSGTATSAEKSELAEEIVSTTVDTNTSNVITLGDSIEISGSGATAAGGVVTISQGGTYEITGTLSDGYICVTTTDEVVLVLSGCSITNSSGPCIYSDDAKTLTVYTKESTENTLTDGESYDDDTDAKGAIFSNDDLVLDGEGTLTVNANYKHAVASDDEIVINAGTYYLNAAFDGVHANETITLISPTLTIDVSGDGIQSDLASVTITGGTIDITTAGGASNASTKQEQDFGGGWQSYDYDYQYSDSEEDSTEPQSFKGIKAEVAIEVSGGILNIDTYDDAVHSNDTITITGGEFNISAGDDAVHADNYLTVSGGSIFVTTCYEGLEGGTIEINDGVIELTASDDGFNAVEDESSEEDDMTNRQAFGGGMSEEGYGTLIISGGTITIDADGDGLDSNGTIEITGGYTIVYGPSDSANGALDYGSSCTVSGGTLVAVGASGMSQDTGDSSTQPGLMLYFSGTLSSSDVVSITDSDGNEILSFTGTKSYNSMALSCEEFVEGETVSVYLNGEKSGDIELTSGVYSATVSSGSLSESSGGGGMGGDMNVGGMNGGDMGGGRMR